MSKALVLWIVLVAIAVIGDADGVRGGGRKRQKRESDVVTVVESASDIPTPPVMKRILESSWSDFNTALESENVEAMTKMFCPFARYMPPNRPMQLLWNDQLKQAEARLLVQLRLTWTVKLEELFILRGAVSRAVSTTGHVSSDTENNSEPQVVFARGSYELTTPMDTGALPRRSARIAVRARPAIPPRPKRFGRRTTPAASSTALTVQDTTGDLPACPVREASEPLADYRGRLQAFADAVAAAEAQQAAAEAERQRLANEAAAEAQRTAETDEAARNRRNAASTESLIASEHQWTTILQGMIFVPTETQAEPTQAEAERSNLAIVMLNAKASAAPGCTTDATKQLNERIDHVVTIIGDIGVFNGPDTISSTVAAIKTDITKLQTRPDAATKTFKMPHFDICKFDDYNKSDALTWWQRFLTEASCRTVPTNDMLKVLYLQLIGGAQAWMNHLAATHKCTIAELHTHITWKEFEQLWFTRFMVHNVVKAAMNEVYTCSHGNMPTRDWTTKWQKIVTTPGFDLTAQRVWSRMNFDMLFGLNACTLEDVRRAEMDWSEMNHEYR
ncbi:hypothetical protein CBR_g22891 [Chara braunii]|uniref:Retrotransposon gag domain-containing protein n=1 Tax=Chara braunii TaxID=69332 RepID=A0A388L2X7_CHABU|nr:hypothetical protein CBR_g22891 [Chara braunii]|eukprot:GBG76674.1 hypothetical protein CBR_g22891 [Chara braunii]